MLSQTLTTFQNMLVTSDHWRLGDISRLHLKERNQYFQNGGVLASLLCYIQAKHIHIHFASTYLVATLKPIYSFTSFKLIKSFCSAASPWSCTRQCSIHRTGTARRSLSIPCTAQSSPLFLTLVKLVSRTCNKNKVV